MTTNQSPSLFEKIRKTGESGNEFWSARELAKVKDVKRIRKK